MLWVQPYKLKKRKYFLHRCSLPKDLSSKINVHFQRFIYVCMYLFIYFCLLSLHQWHVEVPRLGDLIRAVAAGLLPQQHQIQVFSVTYTIAQGNARSLTHWARPGIKPATSRFLVRFIYAVPQWPRALFFNYPKWKFYAYGNKVQQLYCIPLFWGGLA